MILTSFPREIIAGDSYSLLLAYSDYPASAGWSITLYLNGPVSIQLTGSASSDSYAITIPTTKTGLLTVGTYAYSIAVSNSSGEKHTVESGFLAVSDNLAGKANTILQAERILNAINCAIEGRITDDVQTLSIAGRSISLIPVTDLMTYRAMYTKELAVLKGGQFAARRTIPVVFSRH